MMILPSAGSTSLAALVQSRGGAGTTGGVLAEMRASVPGGQGAEKQPVPLFSTLLAASMPRAAQSTPDLAQTGLPGDDALSREVALAGLADDLMAGLIASPGTISLSEAVAQFVDVLQQFDVATGGNATEVLAANLAGFDAEGLAGLDAAAADPASLFAALAELAGISSVANHRGLVSSSQVPQENPVQGKAASSDPLFTPTVLKDGAGAPSSRGGAPWAVSVPDVFSMQKLPASPGDPHFNTRALVAGAIASAAAGAEGDAVPLFATSTDARSVAASMPDIARPAEPGPRPTSGFARNVVQQIRGASFVDGHTRIALAPRGLGEIEIDMRADEAGKLRVVLRAENPAVLQALRGDRDGLLLALADGGAGAEDAELEFEDFSRRQQRDPEFADATPGRKTDADPDDTTLIAAPPGRPTGTGTLDMLT